MFKTAFRKVLAVTLIFAVCMSCGVYAFASLSTTSETRSVPTDVRDTSEVKLMYEKKAFTQDDLQNNFSDYASEGARVSIPQTNSSGKMINGTNVVGVVLDNKSEEPVANAAISIDGVVLVRTGIDGRFQIENVEDGKYTWGVEAEGYYPAEYRNYGIDHSQGAHIFTFYIDTDVVIEKDRSTIKHGCQELPIESSQQENEVETTRSARLSSVPTIESTVSVRYNNVVRDVDREEYLYGVVAIETGEAEFYTTRGLTSTQLWQLYCAQAIASNTFLEYAKSVYSRHGSTCDVCDSAHCQAYDPTEVTQVVITAVSDIFYTIGGEPAAVVMFYEPSRNTYEYFWSAFGSSCYGQGTRSYGNTPALQGVSCTDLATGWGGERYGMCQMGAAYLAKQGYSANDILMYYYTDCDTEFCLLE